MLQWRDYSFGRMKSIYWDGHGLPGEEDTGKGVGSGQGSPWHFRMASQCCLKLAWAINMMQVFYWIVTNTWSPGMKTVTCSEHDAILCPEPFYTLHKVFPGMTVAYDMVQTWTARKWQVLWYWLGPQLVAVKMLFVAVGIPGNKLGISNYWIPSAWQVPWRASYTF